MKSKYVTFILLLVSCFLSAQKQAFRHYSTINGLSSSCVYSCIQDSVGFLWFATDKGLCRFDGNDFFDFDLTEINPKNVTTTALALDKNFDLLIGSYNGFSLIKNATKSEKINIVDSDYGDNSQKIECQNNMLYSKSLKGYVLRYDFNTKKKFTDEVGTKDELNIANALYKSSDNTIYVARKKGLYMFSGGTYQKRLNILQLNDKNVFSITEDHKKNKYVSVGNKVYTIVNNAVTDSVICSFYKGNDLFLAYTKLFGLIIYDINGNGNQAFHNIHGFFDESYNSTITSVYDDRDHNVWVNTFNNGSYCILNSYITTFSGKNKLYNSSINDVYVNDDNIVYMATSQGLLFKKNDDFYHLDSIKNRFYYEVLKVNDNIFSVASKPKEQFERFRSKFFENEVLSHSARRVCLFNDSTLIFNYWNNVICIYTFKTFSDKLKPTGIILFDINFIGRCTKIFKKNKTQLIVATTSKCYLVDVEKKTSVVIEEIKSKVNEIIRDKYGNIYVASEIGLYIIRNSHITLLKELNGISLRNLSALAFDNKQRLWLGSNKGLLVWKDHFFKKISGSPYMKSNEINKLFYHQKSNQLYVASTRGLSVVDIKKMDQSINRSIDVILLKVQAKDSVFNPNKSILLNSNQYNIDIYFSAIEIDNPEDLYFRYKIDNNDWSFISEKKISLTELKYGTHSITIQASIDGINWGKEATVDFYIEFPFYFSIRFLLIVFISLIIIAYFLFQFRIKKIKQKISTKIELQQRLEDLRYQALSAAVNPHFIFNTLGAIQSYVTTNDKFLASDYIAKFAKLIRITLNHAGEKYISLDEEINRLTAYLQLEKLRCGDKLTYSIEVEKDVNLKIQIPNMIIQPVIENSIIHGILRLEDDTIGLIKIYVFKEGNVLIIIVDDNGVGYSKTRETKHGYKSIGLSNLEQRLSIIKHSEFSIKNKNEFDVAARGTLVSIKIPLSDNYTSNSFNPLF